MPGCRRRALAITAQHMVGSNRAPAEASTTVAAAAGDNCGSQQQLLPAPAPAPAAHRRGEEIVAMIPPTHRCMPSLTKLQECELRVVSTVEEIQALSNVRTIRGMVVVHFNHAQDHATSGKGIDSMDELQKALAPGVMPALQWVHTMSAGVDHLPHAALAQHVPQSVTLTHNQGVSDRSLSEFAVLGCLHFAKSAAQMAQQLQDGQWNSFITRELRGATLGVIGMGSIGSDVVCLAAQGFQMRVLGLRRSSSELPDSLRHLNSVDMVSPNADGKAKLLRESDYIVLCMPHTAGTVHTISSAELATMKSSCVLINIGRGSAIDSVALAEALCKNEIRGAALDVVEQEPLDATHPLWKIGPDKLLLSPHTADLTEEYWPASVQSFRQNLGRLISGQPLLHTVNLDSGY
jgi:phosphoglycerate dehydrogenase-like enzyme